MIQRSVAHRVGVIIVLVAFGAAVAACGGQESFDDASIAASTVGVRADGCGPRTILGTATSIGDDLLITAAHVVAGADRVEIVDGSGDATTVDVVFLDPDLDVAALRSPRAAVPPAALRGERAEEGERGVVAVAATDGSVDLLDVEVVQRATILTTDIYREGQVRRPGLRVSATVEPGNSGAMVHLDGGGVGVVWSRSADRADQAWTVELPDVLRHEESRRGLTESIAPGRCA